MKPDGGPAFPMNTLNVPFDEANDPKYLGMTLRDYFAAAALQGLCAMGNEKLLQNFLVDGKEHGETEMEQTFARYAYEYADAMLTERAKT